MSVFLLYSIAKNFESPKERNVKKSKTKADKEPASARPAAPIGLIRAKEKIRLEASEYMAIIAASFWRIPA